MSFKALSSSIRVLFWFSSTATRFSRHLTYSFFFRRHSRAASLEATTTVTVKKKPRHLGFSPRYNRERAMNQVAPRGTRKLTLQKISSCGHRMLRWRWWYLWYMRDSRTRVNQRWRMSSTPPSKKIYWSLMVVKSSCGRTGNMQTRQVWVSAGGDTRLFTANTQYTLYTQHVKNRS